MCEKFLARCNTKINFWRVDEENEEVKFKKFNRRSMGRPTHKMGKMKIMNLSQIEVHYKSF